MRLGAKCLSGGCEIIYFPGWVLSSILSELNIDALRTGRRDSSYHAHSLKVFIKMALEFWIQPNNCLCMEILILLGGSNYVVCTCIKPGLDGMIMTIF